MAEVLLRTDLPGLRPVSSGKVRDMFDLGDALLIVASDRISAFDVVLPNGIPHKGHVLTALSKFWFDSLQTPHHLITTEFARMPVEVRRHEKVLRGRSMVVKKAKPFPVECVARGYLAGSGWKEYQQFGSVCGIPLPRGLRQAQKLPEPIFTPATKAEVGHDENISYEESVRLVGEKTANQLRARTLEIYRKAAEYAEGRGVLLADTKFEFGLCTGELLLIDEVLTPDSSRFWPKSEYRWDTSPPSFDKQFVRDYLESIGFNKTPPAPPLPEEVIHKTSEKYVEAYRLLTGKTLETG